MLLDTVFLVLTSFFVSFCWSRYYVKDNVICLLIALLISAQIYLLVNALFKTKKNKNRLKKDQQKKTEALRNYLAFLPQKETIKLFSDALGLNEFKAMTNALITTVSDKKTMFVFDFCLCSLTPKELAEHIKNACEAKTDSLVIYADGFDKFALTIVANSPLPVKLFDISQTFLLFDKKGKMPEIKQKPKNKLLGKKFFYVAFDKSRAKYYLFSCLFLLATSFFTFFRIYYLISATILFCLFIYTKFNTRFNLRHND